MSWDMVPLGEIAPSKAANKQCNSNDSVWMLNLDQVESGSGLILSKKYVSFSDVGSSTICFDDRHVLYSKLRPNLNKVVVPDQCGIATSELIPMCPDHTRLDRHYLAHFLRSPEFVWWAVNRVSGAKMPRVVMKCFWEKEIPLPPLDEQKRIAAILDKADAIRRKRQRAIEKADEFLRSVFLDMFGDPVLNPKGWDEAALSDVADIYSGVAKGKKYKDKDLVSVPYLRVANVQDGIIDKTEIKTIEVTPEEVKKYELLKGDILLTEGGDPDKLGRGAVWDGSVHPCIHQNHIFKVRVDESVLIPEFASFLIGSVRGKRYFLKSSKQTTGIASINKTQLSNFPMLVPNMSAQLKFLNVFRSVKKNKEQVTFAAENLDNLFASIQQKAFKGEL